MNYLSTQAPAQRNEKIDTMPAVTDHPSFKQPNDPTISLWRYMDLSKFASLLQRRALVFPRSDYLGDPWEGSVPAFNANALSYIKELRKHKPDAAPHKDMTDAQLEQMYRIMSDTNKNTLRCIYINCWHMNESESAGMWKLYSKSSDAVCIRTDYNTLVSVLNSEVHMGVVNYIDYKTDVIAQNNIYNRFLIKRRSFAHEREARALIMDISTFNSNNPPAIKEVPVDIAALIKAIYVSPEAADWFRDVVADLTAKYGLSVPVEHSEMSGAPLY